MPGLLKAHVTVVGALRKACRGGQALWSCSQEGGTDQCRDEVLKQAQRRGSGQECRGALVREEDPWGLGWAGQDCAGKAALGSQTSAWTWMLRER